MTGAEIEQRIAEIQSRADAAKKAKWNAFGVYPHEIVAARSDVPWLCARLKAALKQVEAAEEMRKWIFCSPPEPHDYEHLLEAALAFDAALRAGEGA